MHFVVCCGTELLSSASNDTNISALGRFIQFVTSIVNEIKFTSICQSTIHQAYYNNQWMLFNLSLGPTTNLLIYKWIYYHHRNQFVSNITSAIYFWLDSVNSSRTHRHKIATRFLWDLFFICECVKAHQLIMTDWNTQHGVTSLNQMRSYWSDQSVHAWIETSRDKWRFYRGSQVKKDLTELKWTGFYWVFQCRQVLTSN